MTDRLLRDLDRALRLVDAAFTPSPSNVIPIRRNTIAAVRPDLGAGSEQPQTGEE